MSSFSSILFNVDEPAGRCGVNRRNCVAYTSGHQQQRLSRPNVDFTHGPRGVKVPRKVEHTFGVNTALALGQLSRDQSGDRLTRILGKASLWPMMGRSTGDINRDTG
jgi:hypothetical protein